MMIFVVLTQSVMTEKKIGIFFLEVKGRLSQDSNIVHLEWCRIVGKHSDDVTTFI
jgi:hypothetical protein